MKPWKIGKSYKVAFSRDGQLLAALGRDVFIWDDHHPTSRHTAANPRSKL